MRLRFALVVSGGDLDDERDARLIARGGPRDGRRSWAPGGRGQGPAAPVTDVGADESARDHTTRLIEALATVLGRRLDVIEARLDGIVAATGTGSPAPGPTLGTRLDRLDRRLDQLISATAEGAGMAGTGAAPDPALRLVLARLEALEQRLTDRRGPDTAEAALARVEARLDQLNRLLLG